MTISAVVGLLDQLITRRDQLRRETTAQLERAQAEGREELLPHERRALADLQDLESRIAYQRDEVARMGTIPYGLGGSSDAMTYGRVWADRVADKVTRAMGHDGERRAVVSGTIDIPSLVETEIIAIARPQRLIDLFPNRASVAGNAFEYYQQTVRDNKATAVPDAAVKPTSTLTVTPHTDRCRVIGHLSEPTPNRLWVDHDELRSWLTTEMLQGVLDGLEDQVVAGDGTGENMLGLLNTPGTTTVAFATDAVTTLRSALTALQVLGETPTGWALNPVDAQAIDLLRWGTSGGLLVEGYENPGGDPSSNNIFGPGFKRVVSNSVPVGSAILGDWSKLRLYVREDATLAIDASGELFTKNLFVARGEGRFGIGVLRPSSFAVCDLSA
jgi:HK97 family phage major capsid protein